MAVKSSKMIYRLRDMSLHELDWLRKSIRSRLVVEYKRLEMQIAKENWEAMRNLQASIAAGEELLVKVSEAKYIPPSARGGKRKVVRK